MIMKQLYQLHWKNSEQVNYKIISCSKHVSTVLINFFLLSIIENINRVAHGRARATIESHFEADKSILRFRNARDASATSSAEQLLWIARLYATRSHRVICIRISDLCKGQGKGIFIWHSIMPQHES